MNYRYNVNEINTAAQGRWHEIFLNFNSTELSQALQNPGKHVPCPIHGGNDGFRFFKDFQSTGMAICNTCGTFSPYRLLQELNGWEFKEALQYVAEFLKIGEKKFYRKKTSFSSPVVSISRDQKEKRKKIINKIWSESLPLTAPEAEPARLYLARRGFTFKTFINIPSLRFHPELGYFKNGQKEGVFPGLIAKFINNQGETLTLHRTYLTNEGLKAPVDEPKKLLPSWFESICGGYVVLAKVDELKTASTIGLAEGIETALAVIEKTGLPMLAATSAVFLEKVNLSNFKGRKIVIWADNDRTNVGQESACRLVKKLKEEGFQGKVYIPDFPPFFKNKKSWDWADVLLHCPQKFPVMK